MNNYVSAKENSVWYVIENSITESGSQNISESVIYIQESLSRTNITEFQYKVFQKSVMLQIKPVHRAKKSSLPH